MELEHWQSNWHKKAKGDERLFIWISKRRTNYVLHTPYWQRHKNIPPHNRFQVRNTRWSGPNNAPGTLTCSYSTYVRTRYAVILSCSYVLCQGRSMIELWGRGVVEFRGMQQLRYLAMAQCDSSRTFLTRPPWNIYSIGWGKKVYSVLRKNDLNARSVQDDAWVKSGVRLWISVNTVVCTAVPERKNGQTSVMKYGWVVRGCTE